MSFKLNFIISFESQGECTVLTLSFLYVIATLSVYPHRASLKNMPGHGGIRTYDLWNASSSDRTVHDRQNHALST